MFLCIAYREENVLNDDPSVGLDFTGVYKKFDLKCLTAFFTQWDWPQALRLNLPFFLHVLHVITNYT